MHVKAAPGTRCPSEGKPRVYIGDAQAVEVAASAYYLRLIADGSLIEEKEAAPKAENKTSLKATAKA